MEREVLEMIDFRTTSSVILMKFIQDYDEYPNKLFCFFEGEDYKYYRSRLLEILEISDEEIFHYECKGKKEVLKLYDMLKKDRKSKKIFFIDRDFDDKKKRSKSLFQTERYSIENYYISDSAFGNFISTEFNLNRNNVDFKRCISDYHNRKTEFNNAILKLNAYIYYVRYRDCNDKRLEIGDTKTVLNNFIKKIEVDKIIMNEKSYDEIKNILRDDKEFIIKDIEKIEKKFNRCKNKEYLFRGKFELYFLKKFYNDLKKRINECDYFEKNINIKLDINSNTLTLLSTYADTPEDLKKFLLNFKINCL